MVLVLVYYVFSNNGNVLDFCVSFKFDEIFVVSYVVIFFVLFIMILGIIMILCYSRVIIYIWFNIGGMKVMNKVILKLCWN